MIPRVLRRSDGDRVGYQCSVCGVLYLNDQEREAVQCCRPEPSKDLLDTEARANAAEIEVARLRRALEAIESSADPAGWARKELRDSEKRYRK